MRRSLPRLDARSRQHTHVRWHALFLQPCVCHFDSAPMQNDWPVAVELEANVRVL